MRQLWTTTLVIAVAACGTEEGSNTATVTDSAGVQIVHNTDYAWPDGQGWRLSDEPVLHQIDRQFAGSSFSQT